MAAGEAFTYFKDIFKSFTGQISAVFDTPLLIGLFFINHKIFSLSPFQRMDKFGQLGQAVDDPRCGPIDHIGINNIDLPLTNCGNRTPTLPTFAKTLVVGIG